MLGVGFTNERLKPNPIKDYEDSDEVVVVVEVVVLEVVVVGAV